MRTIRFSSDEALLSDVERLAAGLKVKRSVFARAALRMAVHEHRTSAREQQHAEGYAAHPAGDPEAADWAATQIWEPV
ncbi:MAG TPA: hypothetical protein VM536_12175 [Chloroflexia bacterium]|nr:hypothetical protein [Chloroflexia bacterium]